MPQQNKTSMKTAGPGARLIQAMADFREEVRAELKRRGWSVYQLVKALGPIRPNGKTWTASVVYDFVAGRSSINSDDLGEVFRVLGLKVQRPKR
jgi:hypothetical protein